VSENHLELSSRRVTMLWKPFLRYSTAAAHQVDDENDQCHDQQQMDERSAYMETEAQQPQNS
jgi:hypothetical protein